MTLNERLTNLPSKQRLEEQEYSELIFKWADMRNSYSDKFNIRYVYEIEHINNAILYNPYNYMPLRISTIKMEIELFIRRVENDRKNSISYKLQNSKIGLFIGKILF